MVIAVIVCLSCSKSNDKIVEEPPQTENTSLTISDGTQFVPKDFYPEFSWNVTPQYCMFGDGSRTLTASEVSVISEKS